MLFTYLFNSFKRFLKYFFSRLTFLQMCYLLCVTVFYIYYLFINNYLPFSVLRLLFEGVQNFINVNNLLNRPPISWIDWRLTIEIIYHYDIKRSIKFMHSHSFHIFFFLLVILIILFFFLQNWLKIKLIKSLSLQVCKFKILPLTPHSIFRIVISR